MASIDRVVDQSVVGAFPMITISTVVSNEIPESKPNKIIFTNQNLPIEVISYIKYQQVNQLTNKHNDMPS